MVGLWLTEGKWEHAVDSMTWLGGKWKSSEVQLLVNSIEQTLSRERVLEKLDVEMETWGVLRDWWRRGREFDSKLGRWRGGSC